MKVKTFIFYLLALPSAGYSQKIYTVDDCIEIALENNLSISNSRYDQLIYQEQIKEAKRSALPTIGLGAEYDVYMKLPTTVFPNSAFDPAGEGFNAAAFGTGQQSTYSLQLNQVIYNPSLGVAIKAAGRLNELGNIQYEQTQEDIVYQVASNYYNAQVLSKQIAMLQANSTSLDTLITSTRYMEENGLVNITDVNRLVVNKASIDNSIATIQADYDLLINSLKLLLNLDQSANLTIVKELSPESVIPSYSSDLSVQNRTDIKFLHKQMEILDLQEKQITSGYQPSLSAVATYGVMGFGENDANYYEHYDFSYIGLQMNWTLFDGLVKRTQRKQKRLEMSQLQSSLSMTRRNIENEHTNALSKYRTHLTELENQKYALELAEDLYANTNFQYSEGLVGVQEVIQVKDDLTEAQTNYLNAWVNLQQAKLDLAKADGQLLSFHE